MKPDVILVKFNVNEKWEGRLKEAGVPLKTPDEAALELKHMFHALGASQNPYAFRQQIADSGIPVFGKEGARDVSINGLFAELRSYGYFPSGVHVRTREDKKFNALVIPFAKPANGNNNTLVITGETVMGLIKEFIAVSWGFVHVWANPPQEDGRVIHTVNLSHRDVDKIPQKDLHFQKGEWILK